MLYVLKAVNGAINEWLEECVFSVYTTLEEAEKQGYANADKMKAFATDEDAKFQQAWVEEIHEDRFYEHDEPVKNMYILSIGYNAEKKP